MIFVVRSWLFGRSILVAMLLFELTACVYGVPIVDPASVIFAVDAVTADGKEAKPKETRVTGNFEKGLWFDGDLFSVHVQSGSLEDAQSLARSTASDTCSKRHQPVKIIDVRNSEDPEKFAEFSHVTGYSYENLFRCE